MVLILILFASIDALCKSGPTCKKAVDFGDKHVFKSSTFEPTPDAIRNADLVEKRVKAQDAQNRRAMSSPALPTIADMDIMELTDGSDDELPTFEDLLQQSSSQKSNSSQKTMKRLESMKLEDDGLEMMGDLSPSPGSFSHSPTPILLFTHNDVKHRKIRASRKQRLRMKRRR